jgi:TonB family protein
MMTGAYKDKALSTEHGEFKYFYANGVVESQGRYANGNKVGVWNRWSYDGNPKPDRQYAEENFKKSTRTTASAKFPGGMTALQQMVNDSLVYPAEAIERKIEGTVYVTFVIDTSGDVRNAEVTGSVHYLLDEEALRFVSTMPTWTPATRNGLPVDSNFIMPITFGTSKGQ